MLLFLIHTFIVQSKNWLSKNLHFIALSISFLMTGTDTTFWSFKLISKFFQLIHFLLKDRHFILILFWPSIICHWRSFRQTGASVVVGCFVTLAGESLIEKVVEDVRFYIDPIASNKEFFISVPFSWSARDFIIITI